MSAFLMFLVQLFILQPFQAEFAEQLQRVQAPAALVQQMRGCISTAAPALVQKVSSEPVWGASAALQIWLLSTPPDHFVSDVAPECGPAIAAARTFLNKPSS